MSLKKSHSTLKLSESRYNKIKPLSNSNSSIFKFFLPEVEMVQKLKYFENKNEPNTFFNLKKDTLEIKNSDIKNNNSISLISNINFFKENSRVISDEKALEAQRKDLEAEIHKNKSLKKKLKNETKDLDQIIKELEVDIDALNNEHSHEKILKKYDNYDKHNLNSRKSVPTITKGNENNKSYEYRFIIHKAESNLENEIHSKTKELENLYEKRKDFHVRYEELSNKIKSDNAKLEIIYDKLVALYHQLLSNGKDTRKEGLSWIIKTIWGLNSNVFPSYFPHFLDEKAIQFIFEKSRKEIEITNLVEEIKSLKIRFLEMTKLGPTSVSKSVILSNIKGDISSISNLEKRKYTKKIFNKFDFFKFENNFSSPKRKHSDIFNINNQNQLERRKRINPIRENGLFNEIKELEEKKISLSKELEKMKEQELDRLNNEFIFRSYARRFNVKRELVLSALVGDLEYSNYENIMKKNQFLKSGLKSDINFYSSVKNQQ